MNIQYNKHKQELKGDPLVDWLAKAKESVIANAQSLIIAGVVVAVVVGGYFFYQGMKASSIRKAQNSFGTAMMAYSSGDTQKASDALNQVLSNHGNTPQASYSAFLLGNLLLKQSKYDEAIAQYEIARSKGRGTFVAASALEGLAACYEGKGDQAKAVSLLEQAINDDRIRYRHPALRWKLALLSKDLQNFDKAQKLCQDIVSDTMATDYRSKAENLLVELDVLKGS